MVKNKIVKGVAAATCGLMTAGLVATALPANSYAFIYDLSELEFTTEHIDNAFKDVKVIGEVYTYVGAPTVTSDLYKCMAGPDNYHIEGTEAVKPREAGTFYGKVRVQTPDRQLKFYKIPVHVLPEGDSTYVKYYDGEGGAPAGDTEKPKTEDKTDKNDNKVDTATGTDAAVGTDDLDVSHITDQVNPEDAYKKNKDAEGKKEVKAEHVTVKNPEKLTNAEKAKVEEKVRELHKLTKADQVVVADNGDVTVKKADGTELKIAAKDIVKKAETKKANKKGKKLPKTSDSAPVAPIAAVAGSAALIAAGVMAARRVNA